MPTVAIGTVVLYHFKRLLPSGNVVIQSRPAMVLEQSTPSWSADEYTMLDVSFAGDDVGPGGEPYCTHRTRSALYHKYAGDPTIPTHNTWSRAGLDVESGLQVPGRVTT
jgi:hypothetical protein